jgi:hypothetical protein
MWYTPFWEGRSKHHTACVPVLRKIMQLNHWSRFAKSLTCYQVTLKATQISSRLSRLCLSIPHRSNTFSNMSKLQPQKATLQPCNPAALRDRSGPHFAALLWRVGSSVEPPNSGPPRGPSKMQKICKSSWQMWTTLHWSLVICRDLWCRVPGWYHSLFTGQHCILSPFPHSFRIHHFSTCHPNRSPSLAPRRPQARSKSSGPTWVNLTALKLLHNALQSTSSSPSLGRFNAD